MALSSELMLRLETGEPLQKRLRLAKNAYYSTDLALNHKEDKIIKWLCDIASTDLVVWNTLRLCIHCETSNTRNNLSQKTKIVLIDALVNKLKLVNEENFPKEILDCCNWILSATDMQHFFQTKINKLGIFLRYLFTRLKSETSDESYSCILNAIDSLVKIYKQCTDKDKLAETFLHYILNPLCALIDPKCKDNSNRIGAEAHKCMQQILFPKGRYTEFKEYFKEKSGDIFPAELFRTIAKQIPRLGSNNTPHMIIYLFRAAIGSYKTDSSLVDSLFREFVNISGDFKIVVANSLMEYMADVALNYGSHEEGDVSLTEFLRNLIEEILKRKKFIEEDYDLVRNITSLNPLVLETKLPQIFKRILLETREKDSEQLAYVRLLIGILEASSRLRREQKFIPWLLLALHEALETNTNCGLSTAQILPIEFISKYTDFASELSSSHIIAILRSLTFHLKSNCVEEYENRSKNQLNLMAECTVSLLVAFFEGVEIFESTVLLGVQKKFVAALGQLGDVLSTLGEKIINSTYDKSIMVVLFEAILSWSEVQSVLDFYVPESEAGNLRLPISDNVLKELIQKVDMFGDIGCKNVVNTFLFHRMRGDLEKHKPQEKLTGFIGKLEDCWQTILNDYPQLIPLLDFDQLSEFASLIITDIMANSAEKWGKTLVQESYQENEKLITAILCHALIKIGSLIEGSASASITARIKLNKILENTKNDAAVPALNPKRPIRDIPQLPNLSKNDFSNIEKCLQTLFCIPLSSLSIPLRTMTFVTMYVLGKECGADEGIKVLCEKIAFDSLEEGGLNVFDFIHPTSLMTHLTGNRVLQKVFKMSFRNAEISTSMEHLASLDSCPDEAVPAVLSSIENLRSKLNTEQKLVLSKVEKKLGKKVLSKDEKNIRSAQRIQSLTAILKIAIGNNRVKGNLKKIIKSTLHSTFVKEGDDEKENLTDENQNLNGKDEVIKEGLELAAIALQHRTRLDFPEELVAGIWMMVHKYPEARLLTPLLEASAPKVFHSVLINLQSHTETELQEKNIVKLNSTLGIWNCVFNSDMGTARNKSRQNAIRKLLQSLQMVEIVAENWPALIKLMLTLVTANHMQLSGEYIDMIILSGARSLREGSVLVYDEVLVLCLALLRSRIGMMTDRLPILLQLYRQAIALITQKAKNKNVMNRHQLALCALNIEKVTWALVKLKRDVLRVCPYVIAELTQDFAEDDLCDSIKAAYKNCVNNLLSICDVHGVALLSRALPAGKREIFKGLNESYNRFHRFTGKI